MTPEAQIDIDQIPLRQNEAANSTGRLQAEFRKRPFALRRQFERLDDKQKLAVMLKFIRHARACDASGCETDPHFLLEVIGDVKRGLGDDADRSRMQDSLNRIRTPKRALSGRGLKALHGCD